MRQYLDEDFASRHAESKQDLTDFSLPFDVSSDYKPAIRVRGSRTFGRPTRVPSRKASRSLQTLSTAETIASLLAEFDPAVLAIFEQFPLPPDEYLTARSDLGLRPVGCSFLDRLSVDLLLWIARRGWVAVEVKRERVEFDDRKVLDNLTAKKLMLGAVNIPLLTFARDDLSPTAATALTVLFAASHEKIQRAALLKWAAEFKDAHEARPSLLLKELLLTVRDSHDLETQRRWFKKALWHHALFVDLNEPIRFDRPIRLFDTFTGVRLPWSL